MYVGNDNECGNPRIVRMVETVSTIIERKTLATLGSNGTGDKACLGRHCSGVGREGDVCR